MVARHGDDRRAERAQLGGCPLVLLALPAVCEITRDEDHSRREAADELRQAALDARVLPLAHVQVGDVENPDGHRRSTL